MGRRKKSETNGAGETSGADNPRAVAGSNSKELTEDQRFVRVDQHAKRISEFREMRRKFGGKERAALKAAKIDLGDKAKELIDSWIESETEDGEAAIKARVELQTSVLRRRGTPVNQMSLFPDIDPATGDERATLAGKLAGMRGEQASPPHAPSTSQYQAWLSGWQEGQAILLANKIKPLEEPATGPELIPAGEIEANDDDDADLRTRFMQETPEESARRRRQEHAVDEALGDMAEENAAQIGDREPTFVEQ